MRRRGFLLITALMLTIILLLVGMGLLGSQASRYEAARQASFSSQARQLALAGLEDARVKMELDINFPPPQGPGQFLFSYSEFLDLPYPTPVTGSYSVTVDSTYAQDPAAGLYYTITSVGSLGPPIAPTAQYRLTAELSNNPNPIPAVPHGIQSQRFFRYTHIQDEEVP